MAHAVSSTHAVVAALPRIASATATPSMPGILMSANRTWEWCRRTSSMAPAPLPASATTLMSAACSSTPANATPHEWFVVGDSHGDHPVAPYRVT